MVASAIVALGVVAGVMRMMGDGESEEHGGILKSAKEIYDSKTS